MKPNPQYEPSLLVQVDPDYVTDLKSLAEHAPSVPTTSITDTKRRIKYLRVLLYIYHSWLTFVAHRSLLQ